MQIVVQTPRCDELSGSGCTFGSTEFSGEQISLLAGGFGCYWRRWWWRTCADHDHKMVERGVFGVSQLPSLSVFTQSQAQATADIKILLETITDCLRFVTEFFEVISESGPHIYHSALQLAPHSSIVRRLYGDWIHSPLLRVAIGVPTSWDACVASSGFSTAVRGAAWSPCGRFVALGLEVATEIRDSNTLEISSILKPPYARFAPQSLIFSPDGRMLACYSHG